MISKCSHMHFSSVSQVLRLEASYLYSDKTCTEGSETQARVRSNGAVILALLEKFRTDFGHE